MIYLSVVIPSYNEAENLKRGVLDEVNDFLTKQEYPWEVVVSDDGSSDPESISLAKEYCASHSNFRFLPNIHAGKHFAVWSGIQAAQGEIALFTDMDQSTPISEVSKLLPYFDKGYDVVIGSRGTGRKNFSLLRQVASSVFREIRRTLVMREIVDTQAGFKATRRKVALDIFPKMEAIQKKDEKASGWKVSAFDVELLVIAKRRGFKIAEVPVSWEDRDVSTGKSRGTKKFVKESIDMLKEILRVKRNLSSGFYNR